MDDRRSGYLALNFVTSVILKEKGYRGNTFSKIQTLSMVLTIFLTGKKHPIAVIHQLIFV
jgi:hypothetical protein